MTLCTCFPALSVGYIFWVWTLIGSLDCLCNLWLASVNERSPWFVVFALVLRHTIENASKHMGWCSYSPLKEPKASSHFPGHQRNWSWKPSHLMHSLSQCPENKSCFLSEWHNGNWIRWSSQLRKSNCEGYIDNSVYSTFAVFTGNWLSSNEVWVRLWSSWREVGPSTPRITYPDWMLRNVIVEDDGMLRESRDWALVTRSESSSKIRNLFGKENTSNNITILLWMELRILRIQQNKAIHSLTCYLNFLSQCYSALFLRVCLVTMYVQYPPQEGQRHWHTGTEEVTQPLHLWCTADRQNRL